MDTLGYVRVSTEQQTGEDRTSLSEQRRAINAHAKRLGRAITDAGVFTDPGVSGFTAEGRPGFMALLAYCEAHPRLPATDGVIIALNDSRFGRFQDPEDATYWRVTLKKLGWIVRFAEGDEIPDGLARNVMRLVGSGAASEYRENLRSTQRRASRAVAETGRWRCEAPLGYRRLATRNDGAQRVLEVGQRKSDDEIVRLTPGPLEEQELIQWMFETYAFGGMSLYDLAVTLKERTPVRKWATAVVRSMLVNPAYVGDLVHGRRPIGEDGKQRVDGDPSQWIIVRNAHPAIIPRELFDAVQRIMGQHKTLARASSSDYTLTGLLRCSCGQAYHGGGGSRGPSHDPGRWLFYRCAGADRQIGTCRPPLVCANKRWIEGVVIDALSDVITHPTTIELIRETAYLMARRERSGAPSKTVSLAKEREQLLVRRKRIIDTIGRGIIEEAEASTTLSEIRARLASVESEQARAKTSKQSAAKLESQAEQIIAAALDFPQMAKVVPPSVLRQLMAPWIERLEIEKNTRTLTVAINRIPEVGSIMDSESRRSKIHSYPAWRKRKPRIDERGANALPALLDSPGRKSHNKPLRQPGRGIYLNSYVICIDANHCGGSYRCQHSLSLVRLTSVFLAECGQSDTREYSRFA